MACLRQVYQPATLLCCEQTTERSRRLEAARCYEHIIACIATVSRSIYSEIKFLVMQFDRLERWDRVEVSAGSFKIVYLDRASSSRSRRGRMKPLVLARFRRHFDCNCLPPSDSKLYLPEGSLFALRIEMNSLGSSFTTLGIPKSVMFAGNVQCGEPVWPTSCQLHQGAALGELG